ncbi:type IV toxin-antitoxin system YeeU family antitoxin [Xenorhabdus bovienii]|uniref:type IV toxin-antitoxin system YeeU family antitoxin n=1 Tax=Xenorhabdus bovienii TaxID=40576 RepID=UPI00237CB2C9|nr:type IV toxin-antitoxin system YeeU family antitoxin [Xenorhabdus bovienii]MDE1475672.1 type IV toxin-antitoxin system YeeU family antitoxin [Xenorhabdus bovienii]MDE1483043.1 type IV toxin-antitoxin system YeeU family antitoxin [Xenorhabdus bovienii]MDE9434058.1 type IV toxin-antitoxin system YeeU family antitoxin [Xenorhabdus bovienii]MDE9442727.1 type IV toxin-antitoxin system YeeU family antitoxin [Xenorhabdus bovienii]MDE9459238.1 type IV toxin-antitoxin system YeeU family antitoxin [X
MPSIIAPVWGLKRNVTPQFGARLVQEGGRLHFLADRADISGTFSDEQLRDVDNAFPEFINHLELMLLSGELNPRYQHCVTLYCNGLTCEADSLGSQGYVYLAIYPTPQPTA